MRLQAPERLRPIPYPALHHSWRAAAGNDQASVFAALESHVAIHIARLGQQDRIEHHSIVYVGPVTSTARTSSASWSVATCAL
jgi:hypothetical protein